MTEHKLFSGDVADVSTFAFHEHRERAPHLEQQIHQGRLRLAADFVREAVDRVETRIGAPAVVIDLGCGDGGLLSLISRLPWVNSFGYDFQPSNRQGWDERNVNAASMNFVESFDLVKIQVAFGLVIAVALQTFTIDNRLDVALIIEQSQV